MALILMRHTTPDVAPGTCYGRTDLNVTANFETEAAAALTALPLIRRIATSPLLRCRKLAEFIGARRQLTVEQDHRLIEMDFGRWEGQAWSGIPRDELDAWAADFIHARPHGGENVAMLRDRTRLALEDWRASGDTTLLVTHSGVIRSALSKGDTAEEFNAQIDFGGFVTISSD
ncbi:MAG: histidine phosphatase family protein [Pseudomonadota bacterium]